MLNPNEDVKLQSHKLTLNASVNRIVVLANTVVSVYLKNNVSTPVTELSEILQYIHSLKQAINKLDE